MAYVYSDLNTFSVSFACVRAGTKRIFCRCPRVDCNVFCIRGEQELKELDWIRTMDDKRWTVDSSTAVLFFKTYRSCSSTGPTDRVVLQK